MSKTRRPPEILRKSHAHLEHEERARRKRELLDALDETVFDEVGELGQEAAAADDAPAGVDGDRVRASADDEDDS